MTTPDGGTDAPSETAVTPAPTPPGPLEPTRVRLAAVLSMLLGALAGLQLVTNPFRDVSTAILLALPGIAAVALGVYARRWARRARRTTSPMAIAGIWIGAIALVLGAVPTLAITVLAERLDVGSAPESPRASALAVVSEERELEDAAALAAGRLRSYADSGLGSAAAFPAELAVSTDEDLLLTLDGAELAELPRGTRVYYAAVVDGTHFELALTGPLGAHARVTGDLGTTPTPSG